MSPARLRSIRKYAEYRQYPPKVVQPVRTPDCKAALHIQQQQKTAWAIAVSALDTSNTASMLLDHAYHLLNLAQPHGRVE
jgi:hypothetical protein